MSDWFGFDATGSNGPGVLYAFFWMFVWMMVVGVPIAILGALL